MINKLAIDYKKYMEGMSEKDFVVVDPPWFYNNRETRLTMKTQFSVVNNNLEFLNYFFKNIKSKIVLMWITSPMLGYFFDKKNSVDLGPYEYRQILTWAKTKNDGSILEGAGYWFRNSCEYLLLFVRKDARCTRSRVASFCMEKATKTGATQKPKEFESLIFRELYNVGYKKGAYIFSGDYTDYDISVKQNIDLVDIKFGE